MRNLALRSAILAACLTAVACTNEQSAAPGPESQSPPSAPPVSPPAPTLAPMTGSLEGSSESQLCALDSVNGQHAANGNFAASASQPITLEGWVATSNLQDPGTIKIILAGETDYEISHATGVARQDVVDAHRSADLANAGFRTVLPTLNVPAGQYALMIGHGEDGVAFVCNTKLSLTVDQ